MLDLMAYVTRVNYRLISGFMGTNWIEQLIVESVIGEISVKSRNQYVLNFV